MNNNNLPAPYTQGSLDLLNFENSTGFKKNLAWCIRSGLPQFLDFIYNTIHIYNSKYTLLDLFTSQSAHPIIYHKFLIDNSRYPFTSGCSGAAMMHESLYPRVWETHTIYGNRSRIAIKLRIWTDNISNEMIFGLGIKNLIHCSST